MDMTLNNCLEVGETEPDLHVSDET